MPVHLCIITDAQNFILQGLEHQETAILCLFSNQHTPEVKLEDFLWQAASDIISILTLPPSTKAPSLAAGDPVRNTLVTLATQLDRI